MNPYSLRTGMMTLISAIMGAGILTVPKAMAMYGYLNAYLAMIFSAICQLLMFKFLGYCQAKYPNSEVYSTMVGSILGKKWGHVVFFFVAVFNLGMLVSLSIVSKK